MSVIKKCSRKETEDIILLLKSGQVVEVEGVAFKALLDEKGELKEIEPGDEYISGRNTGLRLLTCEYVNKEYGWISDTDPIGYPFDIWECVAVEMLDIQKEA